MVSAGKAIAIFHKEDSSSLLVLKAECVHGAFNFPGSAYFYFACFLIVMVKVAVHAVCTTCLLVCFGRQTYLSGMLAVVIICVTLRFICQVFFPTVFGQHPPVALFTLQFW